MMVPKTFKLNFKKVIVYPLPSLQEHLPEWVLWNHIGFCCPPNIPQALVSAHNTTTSINHQYREGLTALLGHQRKDYIKTDPFLGNQQFPKSGGISKPSGELLKAQVSNPTWP